MARAMKDSGIEWLGKIPNDWSVIRGKFLFRERNERGNRKELQLLSPTQKYGVIPQELYEKLSGMKAVKLEESIDYSSLKSIYEGDFCISLRSFQGGFEYSSYNGVVSPAYHVFYKTTDLCNDYYRYLFKERSFIEKMASLTKTFRDGKSIGFDDFANSGIPLPTYLEQKRIADFLERRCAEIDSVITKTEKTIEEYKALKQSIITEAVTKGIRPNRQMKDSRISWIGDIPFNWSVDKVFRIFQIIGSGTTPKSDNRGYYDGDIHWIQSGDINGGFLTDTKAFVSDEALKTFSALKIYKAPFIIMAMYGGSIGNLSISQIDGCVNQACCIMQNGKQDIRYSFYALKVAKDYLVWKALGGGQPNISQETIKQLWLPMPPREEQIEIANYLDDKITEVDSLITKKEQLLSYFGDYKKSVIYEYVAGKKEVVV